MKQPIVVSKEAVTLVGGGEATETDLATARALAPLCVAADSGAHLLLAQGIAPTAVIGDMDSISPAARSRIPPERFHPIAEQDSTDFDKALRNIAAPLVVAIGFTGGQIDHGLAALHTLVRRPERPVVLLGGADIVFLCPRRLVLPLSDGARFSLFPMGAVTGRSRGLHWPIDGIGFAPGQRSGTSNRATGEVALDVDTPAMLCILPRGFIRPVVSALLEVPESARWPAP